MKSLAALCLSSTQRCPVRYYSNCKRKLIDAHLGLWIDALKKHLSPYVHSYRSVLHPNGFLNVPELHLVFFGGSHCNMSSISAIASLLALEIRDLRLAGTNIGKQTFIKACRSYPSGQSDWREWATSHRSITTKEKEVRLNSLILAP